MNSLPTMNPALANPAADPLAELKPLIAPDPVSLWPLAPGWWALGGALLAMIVITLAVFAWRKRYRQQTAYRREATALLALSDSDTPVQAIQRIAAILRRAAIAAGGETYASCPWPEVCALGGTALFSISSVELLTRNQYYREPPSAEALTQLIREARLWLAQLPPTQARAGRPC